MMDDWKLKAQAVVKLRKEPDMFVSSDLFYFFKLIYLTYLLPINMSMIRIIRTLPYATKQQDCACFFPAYMMKFNHYSCTFYTVSISSSFSF